MGQPNDRPDEHRFIPQPDIRDNVTVSVTLPSAVADKLQGYADGLDMKRTKLLKQMICFAVDNMGESTE